MKKSGILICFLVLLLACEKELSHPLPTPSTETEERVAVSFRSVIDAGTTSDVEIVPMSRATSADMPIKATINNIYHVVITKYVDNKWIIDTLLSGKLVPKGSEIYVRDTTSLPSIQLFLRPGKYKAGFFLNAYKSEWNKNLKPGFVVAEREDIQPKDQDLPAAFTYPIQTLKIYNNYGLPMADYEVFAGQTEFTVEKNNDAQSPGSHPQQILQFERRTTRFRYLLSPDTVPSSGIDFQKKTNNFLVANFTAPEATPFCQGLNILGGGYYPADSVCTNLKLHISTVAEAYISLYNNVPYMLCLPATSTYSSCQILMDDTYPDGIECTIKNIHLFGQSRARSFINDQPIVRNFKRGYLQGVVFRPKDVPPFDENYPGIFYMEEDTSLNALELFDPYFESNPINKLNPDNKSKQ